MIVERQTGICPFYGRPCEPLTSGDADYFKKKMPTRDPLGRLVIAHAQELPYKCSSCSWEEGNKKMNRKLNKLHSDRQDAQMVIVWAHSDDVTLPLYTSLRDKPLGRYNVATVNEQRWGDGEADTQLVGESPIAKSIYVFASIENEADFMRAARVADHYKSDLGAEVVTLVAPFMASGRGDKTTDSKTGAYVPKTVNIRSDTKAMSRFFDRAIVWEPHSSATQYFSTEAGMPLLPFSPWKTMVDNMLEKGIKVNGKRVKPTPENAVVLGPDKGRNLAVGRIAEYLDMPYVSFNKTRLSGSTTEVYELTPEEQALVKGKIVIGYDDEGSTFGTANTIADPLVRYATKALCMNLVHMKGTEKWLQNINHPLLTTVFVSDSRQPVGNLNMAGDIIERVTLAPSIREIIDADIQGVNFWEDSSFRSMILQPYSNKLG